MSSCHDAGSGPVAATEELPRIALVGSPNAGKTTIFNALTGLRAKTGNYPGVTVVRREGIARLPSGDVIVDDFPGTYSLDPVSPDEQVVADALSGELSGAQAPTAILAVVDATTIERSLILVAQVLRLGLPTCVVVTMVDELDARHGRLDLSRLSAVLGVPVVGVVATKLDRRDRLMDLLAQARDWPVASVPIPSDPEDLSAWLDSVLERVGHCRPGGHPWTGRIDRVLLHPVAGVVTFFAVMIFFFQVIFTWAVPLQDLVSSGFDWLGSWVDEYVTWPPLAGLLSDGVIAGVGTVLQFLPQIILLFLMISFLENVGYMARAALVMDRVMAKAGLEGRAFVSLLSSYACAVPGIMSTRTIPSSKDRIATILVAPLMTCSARLPIYTLLIATFVPNSTVWGPLRLQGLVLFGLYLLGTASALVIAAIFKRTTLKGETLPFYMEIPPYRVPGPRLVLVQCWDSARYFVRKAGTIILGTSIILWALLHLPVVTPTQELN